MRLHHGHARRSLGTEALVDWHLASGALLALSDTWYFYREYCNNGSE